MQNVLFNWLDNDNKQGFLNTKAAYLEILM